MSIAFSSHGIEFELFQSAGFGRWYWQSEGIFSNRFYTINAARDDAMRYAARITTGTAPGNREG